MNLPIFQLLDFSLKNNLVPEFISLVLLYTKLALRAIIVKDLLQQPLVKITNRLLNKLKNKVSHGNYKRTQQGIPDVFLHYLYKRVMVCASNKQSYPKVYMLSMSLPHCYHKANMPLMSLLWFLLLCSRSMTLHHVTHHVTMIICLFIIQKKKIKINCQAHHDKIPFVKK